MIVLNISVYTIVVLIAFYVCIKIHLSTHDDVDDDEYIFYGFMSMLWIIILMAAIVALPFWLLGKLAKK